jgi:anti-sigma regulatory factor (Ser/Thr protein kinase)
VITAVTEFSQVAQARRLAADFARTRGFDETRTGQVALVATEMATNIVKHGGGGSLVIDGFDDADGRGINLLALDKGRGMADVNLCMKDGYSTAGSPGNGFGAMTRQADRCEVFSRPDLGTAVMARFASDAAPSSAFPMEVGAVTAPYPGETVSGDRWAVGSPGAGFTLLVADGSGHGIEASRAAELATTVFAGHVDQDCTRIVETIHRALKPTRGAAIGIARIDVQERLVRFVGIGNISAVLVTDGNARHMISHNGTAGHVAPRIREFTYPFEGRPLVILHSDGLSAKWNLASYRGLSECHPALIAGVLYRDFRRERDDSSIVAVRALA